MMAFIGVLVLNLVLSCLLGFIHGGILGYFVGILNVCAILIVVLLTGFVLGKDGMQRDIKRWISDDDKMIKETEKEFKNESEHI